MEIVKVLLENPISGGSLVIAVIVFIFYVGISYDTIIYMKHNMVTKKDLKLALLEFKLELSGIQISKGDN